MAKHSYRVLSDNCTLGEKGKRVSVDDDEVNVSALVDGGHLEPVGKTAKEAVAEAREEAAG